MTFRPLADHVLIRRRRPAEKTAGGLVLPGAAVDKVTEYADVVAVGPDVHCVEAGFVIALRPDVGSKLTIDGVEHEVVKAEDVWGIVALDGQAAKA